MCVIDDAGKVVLEQRVPTEPADIIAVLCVLWPDRDRGWSAVAVASQCVDGVRPAGDLRGDAAHEGFADRRSKISKTDRNDARAIAQMMRVGLFKPVHVKTLVAQEQRMLLTSRKLLQRKLLDVECGSSRCM